MSKCNLVLCIYKPLLPDISKLDSDSESQNRSASEVWVRYQGLKGVGKTGSRNRPASDIWGYWLKFCLHSLVCCQIAGWVASLSIGKKRAPKSKMRRISADDCSWQCKGIWIGEWAMEWRVRLMIEWRVTINNGRVDDYPSIHTIHTTGAIKAERLA